MPLQFPTRAERTGSQPHLPDTEDWPAFLYHDPVLNRLFGHVIEELPEFQFYAWDDEREQVVGVGNAMPAAWDGDPASLPDGGIDAVVEAGFAEGAPTPTVLCALKILIHSEYRGQGLSTRMIERMAEIGRSRGLMTLIAGMAFPESGTYVVPGALVPVDIDLRRDEGLYVEPNVWMVHPPR